MKYQVFPQKKTWYNALKACRKLPGADLAKLTTLAEVTRIKSMQTVSKNGFYWIGAANKWEWTTRKGKYIWKHKTGLIVRECGAYSVKKFNMGECTRTLPYICQKYFPEDNTSAVYDDNTDFNGRPLDRPIEVA